MEELIAKIEEIDFSNMDIDNLLDNKIRILLIVNGRVYIKKLKRLRKKNRIPMKMKIITRT